MSAPIDDSQLPGLREVVWPVYRIEADGPADEDGRAANAYAVRSREGLVLVDAAQTWAMEPIAGLGQAGLRPRFHIHTSWATLLEADALDDTVGHVAIIEGLDRRALPRTDMAEDPRENPILHLEHIEPWPLEQALPGACMYRVEAGNILLAGDCARGPLPGEPTLLHPPAGYPSAALGDGWRRLCHEHQIDAVLPRFGEAVRRDVLGDALFDAALANIWNGDAIDPGQGGVISRVNRAA